MSDNQASSDGIGFFGLLTILFIALKLTGVIEWSWWLVVSPIWAPVVTAVFVLLALGVIKFYLDRKNRKNT